MEMTCAQGWLFLVFFFFKVCSRVRCQTQAFSRASWPESTRLYRNKALISVLARFRKRVAQKGSVSSRATLVQSLEFW